MFTQDLDLGKNGLVFYELLDISEGQAASSLVAVDSFSGAITAKISFDFERLRGFHFQVEASGWWLSSQKCNSDRELVCGADRTTVFQSSTFAQKWLCPSGNRAPLCQNRILDHKSGSRRCRQVWMLGFPTASFRLLTQAFSEFQPTWRAPYCSFSSSHWMQLNRRWWWWFSLHGDCHLPPCQGWGAVEQLCPQVLPDFEDGWKQEGTFLPRTCI